MTAMDIKSRVELYDSDFLKIEEGPFLWAQSKVGSRRHIDQFVEDLKDQFFKIGFFVDLAVTQQGECRCHPPCRDAQACRHLVPLEDVYGFEITITGRVEGLQAFDYEQMQHEVRNNILQFPGQDDLPLFKMNAREAKRAEGGHRH